MDQQPFWGLYARPRRLAPGAPVTRPSDAAPYSRWSTFRIVRGDDDTAPLAPYRPAS